MFWGLGFLGFLGFFGVYGLRALGVRGSGSGVLGSGLGL